MTKPVKLAIFDLDGVIANTSVHHFMAWHRMFRIVFGFNVEAFLEEQTKGVSRMDSLLILLKYAGINPKDVNLRKLSDMKNEIYLRLIDRIDESDVQDGVIATLQYLKSREIKIALGSASRNGPLLIERLKLGEYFDYVVDPSNLKGKPEPDIFESARAAFGFDADECIAFEDSVAGIDAIKRAGIFAIGIGETLLKDADIHFNSMSVLPNGSFKEIVEGKYGK
ncbi:MAG: beta-phosphoglucomutase [Firmicutes bacterium HGW-Firmicutes-20]|nr:MAG: beta-phosphoglucomutase [Firmicutes bacterium HGW-Firmicutes-20]PKM86375.1 MAG: beta-phosphoglucomutase [Firmicutes bacterium HGW-Firmicutes-10]